MKRGLRRPGGEAGLSRGGSAMNLGSCLSRTHSANLGRSPSPVQVAEALDVGPRVEGAVAEAPVVGWRPRRQRAVRAVVLEQEGGAPQGAAGAQDVRPAVDAVAEAEPAFYIKKNYPL